MCYLNFCTTTSCKWPVGREWSRIVMKILWIWCGNDTRTCLLLYWWTGEVGSAVQKTWARIGGMKSNLKYPEIAYRSFRERRRVLRCREVKAVWSFIELVLWHVKWLYSLFTSLPYMLSNNRLLKTSVSSKEFVESAWKRNIEACHDQGYTGMSQSFFHNWVSL